MKISRLFLDIEPQCKFVIVKERFYGQPKLEKPKELKNVPVWKTFRYNEHCTNQVFVKDKDIYVYHKDWFSSSYKPSENYKPITGMNGLIKDFNEQFASKYGIEPIDNRYRGKFVYNDCWGEIILRNTAWVKIENIITDIENDVKFLSLINSVERQIEKANGFKEYELNPYMTRFYNDVIQKLFDEFNPDILRLRNWKQNNMEKAKDEEGICYLF